MALMQLVALAETQRQLLSTLTTSIIQINDLKRLKDLYVQQVSDTMIIIKNHEKLIEADCRLTLDKAQEVLEKFQEDKLMDRVSVRKSFEAIYTSEPARESESQDVKKRKNRQYERALKIQKLGCYGAMVLAGTLTTSEWSYVITPPRFNYILEHLPKPPQKCPPGLLHVFDSWGKESPLTGCATFVDSLEALHATSIGLSRHIQHAFSNTPCTHVSSMVDLLLEAITQSRQWKKERNQEDLRTSCVTVLIPSDIQQDGSINLVINRVAGFRVSDLLGMNPINL